MTDRKKPGWVFWTTVVVVLLPLLYVASFGPICWIASRMANDDKGMGEFLSSLYRPIEFAWVAGPRSAAIAINRYCYAFSRPGWHWHLGRGAYQTRFVPLKDAGRIPHWFE